MTIKTENKREYTAWTGMRYRCTNKKCRHYHNYGGRGISVSEEFYNSFEAFLNYMGKKPTSKHSIDRIDNDGNYERGNIRWATPKEQANNKRQSIVILINGEKVSAQNISKELGIDIESFYRHMKKKGATPYETIEYYKTKINILDFVRDIDVKYQAFYATMKRKGFTLEQTKEFYEKKPKINIRDLSRDLNVNYSTFYKKFRELDRNVEATKSFFKK